MGGKTAEELDVGVQIPLERAGKSHIICMWLRVPKEHQVCSPLSRALSGQG